MDNFSHFDNDSEIKQLFAGYSPKTATDDSVFIARLKRNLRIVDLVQQQKKHRQKMQRRAMCMAAVMGFVCGVLCTLFYPAAISFLDSFHTTNALALLLTTNAPATSIFVFSMASVLLCLSTYELTLMVNEPKAPYLPTKF